MSDSASKKDVEDVLSSVRRLVSSELPRKSRPDLPAGPGALVLTNDQRVNTVVEREHTAKSLEDRIAELEAAVSSRLDDFEPDGSEDQAQHRPDRIVFTRPPSSSEEETARGDALRLSQLSLIVSDDTEPEAEEAAEAISAPSFRHASSEVEAQAAEEESSSQVAETEAEVEAGPEAPMAEDVPAAPEPTAEVRRFPDPDAMADQFEARMDGVPSPPRGEGTGFSDSPAVYEPAEEGIEATAHDEGDEAAEDGENKVLAKIPHIENATVKTDADLPVVDEVIEDVAEVEVLDADDEVGEGEEIGAAPDAEEPTPEPEAVTQAPATVTEDAILGVIDEDVLRPIVAELIRIELQGDLGERITRNVRKLVRREILRALNSKEFE